MQTLISKETVEKVAVLARLAVNPSELIAYSADLSNIFALVEKMNHISIPETLCPEDAGITSSYDSLRADKVTENHIADMNMQTLAPKATAGLYLVPQVIE